MPTKCCSKLYVLEGYLCSVIQLAYARGMKVIIHYTSASQQREMFKKAVVRKENIHKWERRDLLWETNVLDFFTHS